MNEKEKKDIEKYVSDTLNDRLGDLIVEKKDKKISQGKQANQMGVDAGSLSNYINGKQMPAADALFKMAKYYNCSTDYLVGINNIKSINCEDIAISKKIGLSEKAIEKLKKYHNDKFFKDWEYMQVINFLIENLDFEAMKRIDRFLFARPTHFMIKDWDKNEYKNTKYLSICSELGDYQFTLDEVHSILLLDIEKLLTDLQEKAKKVKRSRIVKEIDTFELNERVKKEIGESENGEHSTKKK